MREVVEIKTTTEWPAGAWEEHGEAGRLGDTQVRDL